MSTPMIKRSGTTARYSDYVIHQNTVYLVEVPHTLNADISAQTHELLDSIARQLHEAGSDKSQILMSTIYLPDMADFDAFNAIWDAWIPAGTAPTRACVSAKLANPGCRIEIALTAAI